MLKKVLFAVAGGLMAMNLAFAAVEVNKADQAALSSIKGIGATMSRTILEERKKGGTFKNWDDLQTRVKGIGDKNSSKFSEAGLTVNGESKPGKGKLASRKGVAAKPALKASSKNKGHSE